MQDKDYFCGKDNFIELFQIWRILENKALLYPWDTIFMKSGVNGITPFGERFS